MIRPLFWLLHVPFALWLAYSASVVIDVYVIRSSPGAAVYLQGVVCLILPVSLFGLPVLAIIAGRNAGELRRWERMIGWLVGISSLLFLSRIVMAIVLDTTHR